jgi:DNA primase
MKLQTTDLTQWIREIDLAGIAQAEGIELKSRDGRAVGLCPFHADKNPSFTVFRDNRFKCFGCGEHGDPVDFIMKLHRLEFKEALRYLNIEPSPITQEIRKKIQKANQVKAEKDRREQRINDLIYTLGLLISATHKAAGAWKSPTDLEQYGEIYHPLSFWQYCYETLCLGSDEDRNEAIEALKEMKVIKHEPTWQDGFDFAGWLREFFNGVPQNESADEFKIEFQFE